ncbi:MAG: GatB/YqeY domain-containing protein [Candidatus Saccharimonadales bacterium]
MIVAQLGQDLKTALLSKDTLKVTVIRSLKSAVLYAEVAAKRRDDGLSDEEIIVVFQKEAKKRQESAEAYRAAGSGDRAEAELMEYEIIKAYLPEQLDEAEVAQIVHEVIVGFETPTMQHMGQIIAAVRQKTGNRADGALIARLVKEGL